MGKVLERIGTGSEDPVKPSTSSVCGSYDVPIYLFDG